MISVLGYTISVSPEVLVEVLNAMPDARPTKKICFSLCERDAAPKNMHTWPSADSDAHVLVVTFVPEDVAEA